MNEIELRINKIDDLDEVLPVAEEVFKPNLQEKEKYHNKSDWLDKIMDGLLISAVIDSEIVGFAICYKKENDLHIWNVGVLEKYRKNGIWRKMYKEIVNYANSQHFQTLSLNTYKEKFPGMYSFCKNENFDEYLTEIDSLSSKTKSLFRKVLN